MEALIRIYLYKDGTCKEALKKRKGPCLEVPIKLKYLYSDGTCKEALRKERGPAWRCP